MRTVPIHRSLHRVNTFMGGDREVVMCSALIAFVSVFFGQSFFSLVVGVGFWLVVLTFARIINKSDPLMRKVYLSNLRFRQGYFPLVVGGDHSLGLGSVAGAAMACENLGVIWFDAHGDFNTEETSPSGNLHGMPCAALMGWCRSSMKEVPRKTVAPENFYWVGTRDLDPGEVQMAKQNGLHIFSAEEVRHRGMNAVMDDIIADLDRLHGSQTCLRNGNKGP